MTKSRTAVDRILDESGSSASSDGAHRTVQPGGTVVWTDEWGSVHRDDGPAVEYPDGTSTWYKHGALHRLEGPAHADSEGEVWYKDGKMHRDGGPAQVKYGHGESWLTNGQYHRLGGPARIQYGPCGLKEYYIHDRRFTEDEYYRYVDQDTGEVLIPVGKPLKHDR